MRAQSVQARHMATLEVVTAWRDTSLADCARIMREQHVGSLVIIEDDSGGSRPVGILTDRDIVVDALAVDLDPKVMTAGDLMAPALATVREDEDILSALSRMRETGVRRLPVVDAAGRLTGLLAIDNLLEALSAQLEAVVGAMRAQKVRETTQRG
jgi:CBS domain-containing protein